MAVVEAMRKNETSTVVFLTKNRFYTDVQIVDIFIIIDPQFSKGYYLYGDPLIKSLTNGRTDIRSGAAEQ